jgi:CBS domain containing-hemolysin-like protein
MGLLLLYVFLAIGVSFLCSVMEAVLLSITPSYMAALERDGNALGEQLKQYKEDIDRPLAAILSLNTVAHTVGAAGAGAQATVVFESVPVGVISAMLTLMILVFSEIIPKTLGAVYWRNLAPAVVTVLRPTIVVMWPFVKLSQGLSYLLANDEEQSSFSREEFTALAELGEEEGVFEEKESHILRNLFRFNSLRVKDVMTPRTVIFDLPETETIGEVVSKHDTFRFSRIPVYRENRDDVTGYVLKDELLLRAAQEELDVPLSKLAREMLVVQPKLPLPELLERLLDRLEHIALVVDEYGGVAGIVTMEDVVETLLGMEIVDEADSVEDMQALARQQWFRRAKKLGMVSEDAAAQSDVIAASETTGSSSRLAPPDVSSPPSE